jgi:uncharacterized protein (DUF924 family)
VTDETPPPPPSADGPVAATADAVLAFWFEETAPIWWFRKDDRFDAAVAARLAPAFGEAAAGRLDGWQGWPEGCLALCLLLDQVPRNLFRGDARAFATDAKALRIARHAVANGFDLAVRSEERRLFFYLPYEHSEDLVDQRQCLDLVRGRVRSVPQVLPFAQAHLDIIERFGRFPHRNAALGRETTAAEAAFLEEHGGF